MRAAAAGCQAGSWSGCWQARPLPLRPSCCGRCSPTLPTAAPAALRMQWQPEGFVQQYKGRDGQQYPCYDSEKDLIVPLMKNPNHFHKSPLIGGHTRNRTWLAFHRGLVREAAGSCSAALLCFAGVAASSRQWELNCFWRHAAAGSTRALAIQQRHPAAACHSFQERGLAGKVSHRGGRVSGGGADQCWAVKLGGQVATAWGLASRWIGVRQASAGVTASDYHAPRCCCCCCCRPLMQV